MSEQIGSVLDVTHTAEEVTWAAVPRLADLVAVDLLEGVAEGEEPASGPVGSAAVLRRAAVASVTANAPEATYQAGTLMTFHPSTPYADCLATGEPLLIPVLDQAADWLAQDPSRMVKIVEAGVHSLMTIPLRARDVMLGLAHFYRWRLPEPFDDDDLALARDLVGRAAVCVDNARRYTREHQATLALQHSLLPHAGRLRSVAVETATQYLPASGRAGIAGDCFDVLALSGARVGLVVADVAGRGIDAVARAGRLLTAIRTLAGLDLPPEELLAQLSALVVRAVDPEQSGTDPGARGGATCLYAVYDPVTGRCTAASAGHLPPAVARPGRAAQLLDLPIGPPLGVGGIPFEAAEFDLPDDSVIALFTNGLVQDRTSGPDAGLPGLLGALGRAEQPLERLRDQVWEAALRARPPEDDAVLLLARARALPADRVATWELAADPAVVAHARDLARRQVRAWDLAEAEPLTELFVSELVTNAVRYGRGPVRLRMILERSLICEVSDGSSTSPHLCHAASTDEGGRGLFMIAQLAEAWGTRYTPTGKTIWVQQAIRPAQAGDGNVRAGPVHGPD
ncbi:ATP-binding SpoIIE family protein phosphatase [Actinacidiphila acidipaludis]|uniref:Serine/threonine-protein phosphatase n=1 Tax=Actinacidiphila acidipaludis TaxID=2873382 RepID=A0ABS7Q0U6_9ACTN|nr:ATP-binding SpoIIE family protein phosphatase [Streptomyces acidipaludis]MBY8876364.1 serine/threonine-protein phosphatase [Streptomyces acidipaludis]